MEKMKACILRFLVSSLALCICAAQVPVDPKMRSFSSAIKSGLLAAGQELLLYESNTGEPGIITEQWFTGGVMDENAIIRIYIDSETLPSIEFKLLLGHGIGFVDPNNKIPWNTKRVSRDADYGTYNTYQIPFSKSFQVTATHPVGGMFWYIIRGIYYYPLIFGGLQLPSNARLRLYKNVNISLEPLQFLDLANVQNSAGVLFQVTLAANSSTFQYLEACMRAYIDGSNTTTWLSSGTEDLFLSAFYFNEGIFHSDNSGLTYIQDPGAMSAYKFFENDPILFTKSFHLRWRSGETVGSGIDDCPNDFKLPSGHFNASSSLKTAVVTTYTWVYEW